MALDVWCGKKAEMVMELHEVKQLASMADRFQIMEAVSALETAAMGHLSTEACGELLTWGRGELRGEVGAEGVRRGIGSSVVEALRAKAAKGEGAAAHAASAAAGTVGRVQNKTCLE